MPVAAADAAARGPVPRAPQAREQQALISAANSQLAALRGEHDQLLDLLARLDAEKAALGRDNERLAAEVASLRSSSGATTTTTTSGSGAASQEAASVASAAVDAVRVRAVWRSAAVC